MTEVEGNTDNSKTTAARWFYWIAAERAESTPNKQAPRNINIADRKVSVAPGNYLLHWECLGNASSTLKFTVKVKGKLVETIEAKVSANGDPDWGRKLLVVPQ